MDESTAMEFDNMGEQMIKEETWYGGEEEDETEEEEDDDEYRELDGNEELKPMMTVTVLPSNDSDTLTMSREADPLAQHNFKASKGNEDTDHSLALMRSTQEQQALGRHRNAELEPVYIQDASKSEEQHVCRICNAEFITRSFLKAHIHKNHQMTYEAFRSVCSIGKLNFPTQAAYEMHVLECQNTHLETVLKCKDCQLIFDDISALTIHRQAEHHNSKQTGNSVELDVAEVRYSCDKCEKTFASLTGFAKHTASHTSLSIICQSQIAYHRRNRHLQCSQCGKMCKTPFFLDLHMRSHIRFGPYICRRCGKSYTAPWRLIRHLRIHRAEQPYACPQCSATFVDVLDLMIHKRNHNGKPQKESQSNTCDVCHRTFVTGTEMIIHKQRKHTRVQSYICEICETKFITSFELNVHKQTHPGEFPFKCKVCGLLFKTEVKLKDHLI